MTDNLRDRLADHLLAADAATGGHSLFEGYRETALALIDEMFSALDDHVVIDRATIEIVLLDHREELDDEHGKVSASLAELAHVYGRLTGFDAKVEAEKP